MSPPSTINAQLSTKRKRPPAAGSKADAPTINYVPSHSGATAGQLSTLNTPPSE